MEKIFSSYLKNFIFLRNEKLQYDYIKLLNENDIVKNSNIYFVTKIKKIRFDKNPSIGLNFNLKGKLLVGNSKISFNYQLINLYFSFPTLNQYFNSKYDLINYFYGSNTKIDFLNKLYMRYKFYKDFKINRNLSDSDGKNIYINSGLTKRITNESDELVIFSENLLGLLDLNNSINNLDFKGELIYIGKSKEITKRTSKHDKFSKFYSNLKDDEELLFYFLEFDDSNLSINNYKALDFKVISNFEIDEISKSNRISLIEASLINYFKPILNCQEKNKDLTKSSKVKEYLLKNDFTSIHIEIITEGLFAKFGNDLVVHSNEHNIKYNINS
ncbi:hypothetical protein ACNO6Z_08620 [Aliarcobacter lanthieri]|uniref:hypothetical protein n=1 Tax=Aliarcobacter lanthieri TaxID=1355374 RepID=UPI003AA7B3E6